jgi:hypothetical protein
MITWDNTYTSKRGGSRNKKKCRTSHSRRRKLWQELGEIGLSNNGVQQQSKGNAWIEKTQQKLFLHELIYEFIDSIDLIWCIRHRFTHSVLKKLVLPREIIIIATSNFLGNFIWTFLLKLFLHELIYEFHDSIDFIWCIRHWFTHSVIKKLVLTREIIIIATSNFLGNFLWTIFLKLFLHELIYEFIDSFDLIWCIRHRFTHSVIKNWF